MIDLLRQGDEWLARQQRQYAASRVTYARGTATVCLPALWSRSENNIETAAGMLIAVQQWDFVIYAADLLIDGVRVDPNPGDRITTDQRDIFEVMGTPGQDCFSWATPYHNQYIVHTKRIDAQP